MTLNPDKSVTIKVLAVALLTDCLVCCAHVMHNLLLTFKQIMAFEHSVIVTLLKQHTFSAMSATSAAADLNIS